MSERVGRSLRGIVTAALSLLIVTGPVTAALADGGPDRVLPQGQYQATERPGFGDLIGGPNHPAVVSERPGFGDHVQPARPGFGDLIVPTPVHVQAPAPVGVGAPAPARRRHRTPRRDPPCAGAFDSPRSSGPRGRQERRSLTYDPPGEGEGSVL